MRDLEFKAQGRMDYWYQSNGFEIISREGTRKRDLVLARDGNRIRVEEKYRTGNYRDLLVEIEQDLVTRDPGWFYSEDMDRLSYVILDEFQRHKPEHVYWVNWPRFKDWLFHYLKDNKKQTAIISPAGYGLTLNLAIPWAAIPDSLWSKYKV